MTHITCFVFLKSFFLANIYQVLINLYSIWMILVRNYYNKWATEVVDVHEQEVKKLRWRYEAESIESKFKQLDPFSLNMSPPFWQRINKMGWSCLFSTLRSFLFALDLSIQFQNAPTFTCSWFCIHFGSFIFFSGFS